MENRIKHQLNIFENFSFGSIMFLIVAVAICYYFIQDAVIGIAKSSTLSYSELMGTINIIFVIIIVFGIVYNIWQFKKQRMR